MIMMGNFGLLALALTITPVQETTDRNLFRLFNNCEPMSLVVEVSGDDEDVKKVGLTKERVQFAVESRLRGARLFRSYLSLPGLAVNLDGAFTISMSYTKTLFDSVSGKNSFAPTWDRSILGTHGQRGTEYIVSGLSELLDEFLTEYLRVNEDACTGSPQPGTVKLTDLRTYSSP